MSKLYTVTLLVPAHLGYDFDFDLTEKPVFVKDAFVIYSAIKTLLSPEAVLEFTCDGQTLTEADFLRDYCAS